jgi:ferredoxin/flavodoxin
VKVDIKIAVFSQTGNTRKVGQTMATALRDLEHRVETLAMLKTKPEEMARGDLIGIGCPTFECQAPKPVKDFIKALPRLDHRKAFVFATGAGAPGKVLSDLEKGLHQKGASVVGGLWTRSEICHPAPCLMGKSPGHPNAGDLDKARLFAVSVAEHLSRGGAGTLPEVRHFLPRSKMGFYRLVGWITSYKPLVRWLLPKPTLDQSRCAKCEFCAIECPVKNVALEPYPLLRGKCIRCYRCLTGCPNNAFRANWWLGNLVCLTLWNEPFMRWFGDYD